MPGTADARLGRRTLLVAAGTIGVAASIGACGGESAPVPTGAGTPPDASDAGAAPDAVRTQVATAERALIAAYDAAITAYPSLAAQLTPIRSQHADHLAAMAADGAEPIAASAATSAAAAVAGLRAAEQQAARERRMSCVASSDPDLARVLALIAASEQSHAAALRAQDDG